MNAVYECTLQMGALRADDKLRSARRKLASCRYLQPPYMPVGLARQLPITAIEPIEFIRERLNKVSSGERA
jgi:hypothetical protein